MGTVFLNSKTGEVWERTSRSRSPPSGSWDDWFEIGHIDHRYRPHYWGAVIYTCRFCGEYYYGHASKWTRDDEIEGVCPRCNEMLKKYTDIKYTLEGLSYNLDKLKKYSEKQDPAAKFALQAWKEFAAMRRNIQIITHEWLWHLADVADDIEEIRDIDEERKTAVIRGMLYEQRDGRLSYKPYKASWWSVPRKTRATFLAGIDEVGNPFVHPVHPNCRSVLSSLAWATGLTKAQVKAMM